MKGRERSQLNKAHPSLQKKSLHCRVVNTFCKTPFRWEKKDNQRLELESSQLPIIQTVLGMERLLLSAGNCGSREFIEVLMDGPTSLLDKASDLHAAEVP